MMTKLPNLLALVIGCVACLIVQVHAADVPTTHPAKAQLLADVASIAPGKPFTVGVRLTMQPGWHTYWTNPGESGQPIAVKWNLPAGYTAGELRFPVPVRFVQPGDLYGYGYEGEVMLLATVTPPAEGASSGGAVELSANVSWLVCKDICIPGKATVSLSLPMATATQAAAPANEALFKTWQDRVPTDPAAALVEGQPASVTKQGEGYVVILNWKKPVRDVQWFAPAYGEGELGEAKVQHAGATSTITFSARSFDAKNPIDFTSLVATVAYVGEDDVRRGVTVPLAALSKVE
jgi:DsbC/DsbD-like thiol-disulfide interchange protein